MSLTVDLRITLTEARALWQTNDRALQASRNNTRSGIAASIVSGKANL